MKNFFQRLTDGIKNFGFKQWFLLILNIVLVLAVIAALAGVRFLSNTLESLTAAERFRGGGEIRFAQLACYLPEGQKKSEDDIWSFRQSLDTKMVEQSLEAPEGGRLYLDAYCGASTVTVSSENGSATVEAVGVGGNYFYFHPLQLRSGSYISEGDIMDDLVVLDEEMAWRLFGGTDLTGMQISVNNAPFVVAGVISREDDFASRRAYSGDGGIFMAYSALSRLDEGMGITCYEIVMPDPISGYARGVVSETFPVGSGDVVENSDRYGLVHLVKEVIGQFGERSMRTNAVIYPYWENAARLTEDYAAMLLVSALLLGLCPALFALVYLIRSIRRGYRYVKRKVPETVEARIEKHREEALEKKFERKEELTGGGAELSEREKDL